MGSHKARGDAGQVMPLVVLVVMFAVLVAVGVGRLAAEAALMAQAQAAADATALAGAGGGRGAARKVASANGAVIVRYEVDGAEVEVVVSRRGAQAAARAVREGSTGRGHG